MKTNLSHKWIRLACLGVWAAAWMLSATEETTERALMRGFMRQKLFFSEQVLEGMALERFDLISKNAIQLSNMSQSNTWHTLKNPDYLAHTKQYQEQTRALYMAAVDKNLDAVTEAYVKVARNCVDCHRLVRSEQRRNQPRPEKKPAQLNPDRF